MAGRHAAVYDKRHNTDLADRGRHRSGKVFPLSQAVMGRQQAGTTAIAILGAITFCHFLNDVATSLLPPSIRCSKATSI
jgi:hypothetical protein